MRIGLIGVGRIGSLHSRTLCGLAGIDDLVIADRDTGLAAAAARQVGARSVDGVAELFAAGLDGVVIAAPTGVHAALIRRAIESDLPTFCEKPVAATIEETIEVLRVADQRRAQVQIGFQRRFDTGYATARAAVAAGSLGWIHTLRGGTADPAPPSAAYVATSGGIFADCSVHDFDVIRWVTGREIVDAYATGSNRGASIFGEVGDVDTAAAILRLDDDSLAMSATRYNGSGYDVRLEVLGSAGSVGVGLDDGLPLASAEPDVAWPAGPSYTGFVERFHDAYVRELQAFLDVVTGRIESPCTIGDALEAVYVARACEISRREGRRVALAELRS